MMSRMAKNGDMKAIKEVDYKLPVTTIRTIYLVCHLMDGAKGPIPPLPLQHRHRGQVLVEKDEHVGMEFVTPEHGGLNRGSRRVKLIAQKVLLATLTSVGCSLHERRCVGQILQAERVLRGVYLRKWLNREGIIVDRTQ